MLFVLTGEIQTGKTRWLQSLASSLMERGVLVAGVVAPGAWREHKDAKGKPERFEKLGIDNVLLPEGIRLSFARRSDLARAEGLYHADSQSAQAGLGWEISDSAIEQVNAHFASLAKREPLTASKTSPAKNEPLTVSKTSPAKREPPTADIPSPAKREPPTTNHPKGGFLIVDELGRLELLRGEGLTEAMKLLEAGPTQIFPHALIVVRSNLSDIARHRFEPFWDKISAIAPNGENYQNIMELFAD